MALTKRTPYQKKVSSSTEYKVRKVGTMKKVKGVYRWRTFWKGFSDEDTTWEPWESFMDVGSGPINKHFKKAVGGTNKEIRVRFGAVD